MKKIINIVIFLLLSVVLTAQITPPELPSLTTPADNDILVGWQMSGSKMIKLRIDTLKNWLGITSGTYFNVSGANLFPSSTGYNLSIGGSDASNNKLKVFGTSVFTDDAQFRGNLELNGGGGGNYLRLSSGLSGFGEQSDTLVFNSSSSIISKIWSVDTSGDLYFQDQNTGPVTLSDLYSAASGSSAWSLSGTSLYPTASTNNIYIGGSTTNSPIQLYSSGNASFDGNVNVNGYISFESSPVNIESNAGVMEFKDIANTTAISLSDMYSPFQLSGSDVTFKGSFKLGLNSSPGAYDLRVGGFARFNSLVQTAGITNSTNDIQISGANFRLYGGWSGAGDKSDSVKWVNETEDGSAFIAFNDTTDYMFLGDASGTYSLSDLAAVGADSAADLTGVPQKSVLFKNGTEIYDSEFNYDASTNQLKIGGGYGFQQSSAAIIFNSPGGFRGQVSNSGGLGYNILSGSGNTTLTAYYGSNTGIGYTKIGTNVYGDLVSENTITARITDTSLVVKKPLILEDSIGFADGTWQKTAATGNFYDDVQKASVTLTNTQILNGDTVIILSAQGVNKFIHILHVSFLSNITTVYTDSPYIYAIPVNASLENYSGYDSGQNWNTIGYSLIVSGTWLRNKMASNTDIIVFGSSPTSGGNPANTVKVVMYYRIIDATTF